MLSKKAKMRLRPDTKTGAARSYILKASVVSGRVRKTWPIAPPGGPIATANARPKGMDNPRNWCYRRAVLQCLLHLPEFYRYLCREERCKDRPDDCVFCSFRALALRYWDSATNTPALRAAVTGLDTAMTSHLAITPNDSQGRAYTFLNDRQQDAHEYLSGIVNMLQAIEEKQKGRKAFIHPLFNLRSKTAWTCVDCGERHETRDIRNIGINLTMAEPVVENKPLTAYLSEYYSAETLEGLRCDSTTCNGQAGDRERYTHITGGPEILVIQLKRFTLEGKLGQRVEYDETLDLAVCHGPNQPNHVPMQYRLHGVVAHRGTKTGGHYVAAVREQDGNAFAGVNDSRVSNPRGVERLLEPKAYGFDAYLLIYQKSGGAMAQGS